MTRTKTIYFGSLHKTAGVLDDIKGFLFGGQPRTPNFQPNSTFNGKPYIPADPANLRDMTWLGHLKYRLMPPAQQPQPPDLSKGYYDFTKSNNLLK